MNTFCFIFYPLFYTLILQCHRYFDNKKLLMLILLTIEGTELTFSCFVIQACWYALEQMEPETEKDTVKSK